MPSGGHARSGPPPAPNALRRERDASEWVTLPAVGRSGEPPAWPLTTPTKRELGLWARLWAKPQALMWERLDQAEEVALYVRRLMVAEKRNAPGTAFTAVRQLADSLGLTTPGLRANRWRIEPPKTAAESTENAPVVPIRPRVVAADAVEGA